MKNQFKRGKIKASKLVKIKLAHKILLYKHRFRTNRKCIKGDRMIFVYILAVLGFIETIPIGIILYVLYKKQDSPEHKKLSEID